MTTHLLIVDLVAVLQVFCSESCLHDSMFKVVSVFLSCQVQVVWFYSEVLYAFGLKCVQVINLDLSAFFYMQTSIWLAPFVEDPFFCPLYSFGFFIKIKVSISVWVSGSSIWFHSSVCLFLWWYYMFLFTTRALQYSLKLGILTPPAVLLSKHNSLQTFEG